MLPPRLSTAVILTLLQTSALVRADSFHHKIHGIQNAHDDLAHSNRLQHLADLLASSAAASASSNVASASQSRSSGFSSAFSSQSISIGFSSASSAAPSASVTPVHDAAAVSFQIYTTDTLPSPAPPAACASALTASVACNDTIQLMGIQPTFDAPSLAAMCSTACSNSLASYRAAVVSACKGYMMPGPNNATYAPTLAVDTIAGPYNVECEKDTSSGNFCVQVMQSWGAVPDNGILGYPQNELCSSCMLGTLNASLSNPITYYAPKYNTLQQALKICGSSWSSYNVTNPPTTTSMYTPGPSTTPVGSNDTVSSTCAVVGRNITTSGKSTCSSIASQYSVSWYDVLNNNPTLSLLNCTTDGIGAGTALCLPQICTTYTPVANQTCDDIVDAVNAGGSASQSISTTQLISINPNLGSSCENISRMYNLTICVSPHGGFPNVGPSGGGSTPGSTPTATAQPPGQTVAGSTASCGAWAFVAPGTTCNQLTLNNSVTLTDFLTLNPEVNSNCTNLWANYYYCVAPYPPFSATAFPTTSLAPTGVFSMGSLPLSSPSPTSTYAWPTGALPKPTNLAPGTIPNGCDLYYTVVKGDTCDSVETLYGVSDSDFKSWNDNPTTPCPNLAPGTAVCLIVLNGTLALPPTPSNGASGSAPSGCAKWYTIVKGDGCASVEAKFNLTQDQFFALNPELAPNCLNLALDEAYCVKAPPTSTTTGPPTGPTNPPGPPSNLNPGSWNNCTTYYTVQSGDTCNKIEGLYSIAFTDLLTWNPEIKTDCGNLNLAAYCVGISGGCSKTYTVASGDYCSKIETTVSLTDAQLRALNPWIDANCDLQIGQNLCIAAGTPTGPPPPTPTNINPGSWTNCTAYYNVQSGDNCNKIEAASSISFSDFLKWNPEVKTDCSNLNLANYCVKGSGACAKRYTVASGDYCYAIEQAQGITEAKLRSLNTWIDANCDLQLGQALCIG